MNVDGIQPGSELLDRARAPECLGPRQRAEALLAFAQRVARVHAIALDAHARVAVEAQRMLAGGGIHREAPLGPRVSRAPLGRR